MNTLYPLCYTSNMKKSLAILAAVLATFGAAQWVPDFHGNGWYLFAPAYEVPAGVAADGSVGMGITCNASAPTGYQVFVLAGFNLNTAGTVEYRYSLDTKIAGGGVGPTTPDNDAMVFEQAALLQLMEAFADAEHLTFEFVVGNDAFRYELNIWGFGESLALLDELCAEDW